MYLCANMVISSSTHAYLCWHDIILYSPSHCTTTPTHVRVWYILSPRGQYMCHVSPSHSVPLSLSLAVCAWTVTLVHPLPPVTPPHSFPCNPTHTLIVNLCNMRTSCWSQFSTVSTPCHYSYMNWCPHMCTHPPFAPLHSFFWSHNSFLQVHMLAYAAPQFSGSLPSIHMNHLFPISPLLPSPPLPFLLSVHSHIYIHSPLAWYSVPPRPPTLLQNNVINYHYTCSLSSLLPEFSWP